MLQTHLNLLKERLIFGLVNEMKKTIGIIGGMGPLATVKLFERIVLNTVAKMDQDHPRVLIDNNASIPDRTSYILNGTENPLPELLKTATNLEKMGADFLIMPCNTAHYFYKELSAAVSIPIFDMLEEALLIAKDSIRDNRVGLLATDGTIKTGLYKERAGRYGFTVVVPDSSEQEKVMKYIYGIKSGDMTGYLTDFQEVVRSLKEKGIGTIIMGCTELSSALDIIEHEEGIEYIDPLNAIARRAVVESGCVVI